VAPHVKITADPAVPVSFTVGGTAEQAFDFDFPFWETADIYVYIDGEPLASNAYTVSALAEQEGEVVTGGFGGGTVTLDAEVSNCTVVIDRLVIPARETDFSASGPVGSDTLNSDLDRLAARDQDLARGVVRSVRAPPGDELDEMPQASERASRLLGFDGAGQPVMVPSDLASISADLSDIQQAIEDVQTTIAGFEDIDEALDVTGAQNIVQGLIGNKAEYSVASAATVSLASATSNLVVISGTTNIFSFGTSGVAGTVYLCRFTGSALRIVHSSSLLCTCNNNINIVIQQGDSIVVRDRGSNVWEVVLHVPAQSFTKQFNTGGAFDYMLIWGPNIDRPHMWLNGGDNHPKLRTRAGLQMLDLGDTTDLGIDSLATEGVNWEGSGTPHGYIYSGLSTFVDPAVVPVDNATYNNPRGAVITYGQTQQWTGVGHGAYIAIATVGNDETVPWQRALFKGKSLILLGRASFEDSGQPWGTNYGALDSFPESTKYIYNFNAEWNAGDAPVDLATLVIVATDDANMATLAIRKPADSGAGLDLLWDATADEHYFATVSGGGRTERWGIDASGNLMPRATGGVSLGSTSKRFAIVAGMAMDLQRDEDAPALKLKCDHASLSSDVAQFDTTRAASLGFKFFRCSANGVESIYGRGDGLVSALSYAVGATTVINTSGIPVLPTYTVAGLPSAASNTRGMIYVSNETGGAVPAFSDGTNWRRVTDRAVVS
jgi:hypothetical protein